MMNLRALGLACFLITCTILGMSVVPQPASATMLGKLESPASTRLTVQYGDSCDGWRRACARLYGFGSVKWQQCMQQPKAVRACRGGSPGYDDDYRPNRGGSCAEWRRQCAYYYGHRTEKWYQCMGQPKAIRACR